MTDVACFCSCFYSFDGGSGACPKCGEVATVMNAAAYASAGHMQPDDVVGAALAGLRTLLLTAVSPGLADRYVTGPGA